MMQLNNNIIIAAAGSGKTTYISKEALNMKDKRILILTYTNDNLNEIRKKIIEINKVIPANITIQSYYSFLLSDGVRPYQNYLYSKKRINSIAFVNGQSRRYVSKSNIETYFLRDGKDIFTDKISLFVKECNEKSGGAVIHRLENIYNYIYIDEVQDLSGYDLDLIELLFRSKINVTLVGDIRQATYSTNNSNKNKKYKRDGIYDIFLKWQKQKLCCISYRKKSFRCNQSICNLADGLYPDLEKTISENSLITGHDGIFVIKTNDVDEYIKKYNPQLLRYDKRTKCDIGSIMNFGASKGLTFDRVLILPNGPLKKFLKTGNYDELNGSKAKYYVAFTRARYSVCFIYDGACFLKSN